MWDTLHGTDLRRGLPVTPRTLLILFTTSMSGLALHGCVFITAPLDDTDDSPVCTTGTVTFTPTGGAETDVTSTFGAGTAQAPASFEVTEPGTLAFCDGSWYASVVVSADEATLLGLLGAETTILSGGDIARVVTHTGGDSIEVEGLTLTEGAADNGAALLSEVGDIELRASVVTESNATTRGGAIAALEGEVEVVDSTITDNTAGNFGGAVFVAAGLTMTGSRISDNDCDLVGGGVFAEGGVTISDTVFEDNSANNVGGGLYMGSGTLTDVRFLENRSDISGGGFYSTGGAIQLVRPLFEDNQAAESGGALYLSTASATCSGTAGKRQGFFNNDRAVAVAIGSLSLQTCDFGEGAEDNTFYDVQMISSVGGTVEFAFGNDVTAECSSLTCE
jgi:predicted outer membrane repeat protein